MKIVLAPNAFKESLPAPAIAQAMREGIHAVDPAIECVLIPMADGGDGTLEALVAARQGEFVSVGVHDPLMRPVKAVYGLIDDRRTAVIEMAAASGLRLLEAAERNPLRTTTYGTGELIRDALERGVQNLIIGIGGSATTDAGIGMAAALGFRLLDRQGNEMEPTGRSMKLINRIARDDTHPRLKPVKIQVACDVRNPLLGPEGAAPVYAPQKGADEAMVRELEEGLEQVCRRWEEDFHLHLRDLPGGGAAGGLGAGLVAFCGAELRSGVDLIAEFAGLEAALKGAALVMTGEGRIDESTAYGKVPAGVARLARKHRVPAIALTGNVGENLAPLYEAGLKAILPILIRPMSLPEALENTRACIRISTEQALRLWLAR
jgi:glycerate kinase